VELRPRSYLARTALGTLAGPLFVAVFTVIGSKRAGYDWKRHAVSSLGRDETVGPSAPISFSPAPCMSAPHRDLQDARERSSDHDSFRHSLGQLESD